MKKVLIKTTIFLLIAVMAFALTGCDELFQVERTEQLPKFKDFNALLEYMQKMPQGYMYGMRGGMAEESAAMDDATAPGAKNEAQGDGQSHGETNVQVSGIDEADVIKNDGRYLYFVAGNRLVIVDAIDPANMTVAGRIVLDDMSSFSEMFITGNRLTAIGYSYEENTVNKENNEKKVAPGYIIPGRSFTFAKVYDITDRSNPVMTREFKIEGSPLSTRVKDNKLYLVTNKWAYFYGAEGVQPRAEDILPVKYDSKAGKDSTMINPGDIAYLPNPVDNSFMTISVMEINGNQAVKTETVMGGGSTVYMSHNALYIVKPAMYFFPLLETAVSVDESAEGSATSEEAPAVAQPTKPPEPKTAIYKYDLTGNTVKYAGTGEVKGDVLNQFSMDEFNGFFRIATTDWGRGESNNNVYILDSNMKNVGAVKNLAPGERIYSVRFSGNTGYVVTFRNMDPLFVLDLSNPSNPKVLGELKIPGFSNYLHPVGDGLLLGLGVDTQEIYMKDDTGKEVVVGFKRGGLKLSLFDVNDPFNPKEIDTLVIGKEGSYSEAQYNHRAFTWWPEKKAAMFSAQINNSEGYKDRYGWQEGAVVVNVVNGKLSLKGILPAKTNDGIMWSYYTPTRVTYIGETVYYLQMGLLRAYNYGTMLPIGEVVVSEPSGEFHDGMRPVEPVEVPEPDSANSEDEDE